MFPVARFGVSLDETIFLWLAIATRLFAGEKTPALSDDVVECRQEFRRNCKKNQVEELHKDVGRLADS